MGLQSGSPPQHRRGHQRHGRDTNGPWLKGFYGRIRHDGGGQSDGEGKVIKNKATQTKATKDKDGGRGGRTVESKVVRATSQGPEAVKNT